MPLSESRERGFFVIYQILTGMDILRDKPGNSTLFPISGQIVRIIVVTFGIDKIPSESYNRARSGIFRLICIHGRG